MAGADSGRGASESRSQFVPKPSWLRAVEGRGYNEEVATPLLHYGFTGRLFFEPESKRREVMQDESLAAHLFLRRDSE